MHETDRDLRQRGRERGRRLLGRLIRHVVGFVDQRANPVGLPALEAGGADAANDLVAARFGQHDGAYGVAPGGNSSMTETSRSAYAVIASVRGIGVAVMIS